MRNVVGAMLSLAELTVEAVETSEQARLQTLDLTLTPSKSVNEDMLSEVRYDRYKPSFHS